MVTSITAMRCTCDRCGNSWVSFKDTPPLRCPNCQSREWNGVKLYLRSHVNEIRLPAPRTGGRPKVYACGRICLDD
jgi:hypothetical protein